MSDPINAISTSSSANYGSEALLPSQTLNQADFLKLLVTQMSSQDPMNPQSNTDFAAQMAQFSALQTSQLTQANIATLSANQQVQQAADLIGKTVTAANIDGTTVTGPVTGVQVDSGTPSIVINGVAYSLSQVASIQLTATSSTSK
jgi:flagellar basal-body rod modification protein FlgD